MHARRLPSFGALIADWRAPPPPDLLSRPVPPPLLRALAPVPSRENSDIASPHATRGPPAPKQANPIGPGRILVGGDTFDDELP